MQCVWRMVRLVHAYVVVYTCPGVVCDILPAPMVRYVYGVVHSSGSCNPLPSAATCCTRTWRQPPCAMHASGFSSEVSSVSIMFSTAWDSPCQKRWDGAAGSAQPGTDWNT